VICFANRRHPFYTIPGWDPGFKGTFFSNSFCFPVGQAGRQGRQGRAGRQEGRQAGRYVGRMVCG